MTTIQYYFRPEKQVDIESAPRPVLLGTYFPEETTDEEKAIISEYEKRYYNPEYGPPAVLFDTTGEEYAFMETSYGIYRATIEGKLPRMKRKMRISSVGGAILTNGQVLFQRRAYNLGQYGGKLDSGAAGIMHIKNGVLDPEAAIIEKLERELMIPNDEIEYLKVSCVHHASDPQAISGMYGFVIGVSTKPADLRNRANPEYVAETVTVDQENLPRFIVENFCSGDLIGDGAAVLLASLPYDVFLDTVRQINNSSPEYQIRFGRLNNGIFIEERINL